MRCQGDLSGQRKIEKRKVSVECGVEEIGKTDKN